MRQRGVGAASLWRERRVSTAREGRHSGVRGTSARPGSGVIAAREARQHGAGAASSQRERRVSAAGAVSSRRGRRVSTARKQRHRDRYVAWEAGHSGVGRAWDGRQGCHPGVGGASAQHGGRHRRVGGASPRRGIVALSLSTHSVLSCRGTFLVGGVTVDSNEEHC